jgi:hypothetical protein
VIATRFEVREARRLGRVAPLAWLGGMLSAVVLNPLKKRVKYNTVKIFSGYDLIRGEVRSPDHHPFVASLRIVAGGFTLRCLLAFLAAVLLDIGVDGLLDVVSQAALILIC